MIQALLFLVNILPLFVGTLWGAADHFQFLEVTHLKYFLTFTILVISSYLTALSAHHLLSSSSHTSEHKSKKNKQQKASAQIARLFQYFLLCASSLLLIGSTHYLKDRLSSASFLTLFCLILSTLTLPWFSWRKAMTIRGILLAIRFFSLGILSFSVLIGELSLAVILVALGCASLFVAAEIGSIYAINHKDLVSRKASRNLRKERLLMIAKVQVLLLFLGPTTIVFLCMTHQLPGTYTLLLITVLFGPNLYQKGVSLAEQLSSTKNQSVRAGRQYYIESLSVVAIFFCIAAGLGIVH